MTPARYDTTPDGKLFGWIYGMGSYSSKQGLPKLTLQNLPALQRLAPAIYQQAVDNATKAGEPVAEVDPKDKSGSLLNTFAVRTWAQIVSLGSQVAASTQALLGMDNSAQVAQMEEAQTILKRICYDTESDQFKGHVASAVRALDGVIGGFGLLGTNAVGLMARDIALVEGLVTGVTPVVPTPSEFLQMMASDASAWDKPLYVGEAIVKYNPLTLAAESLYRVGRAAYDKNAEELRNASTMISWPSA